jgi:ferredoxin-NADP reductase
MTQTSDPSAWREATLTEITDQTPTTKTFMFRFDGPVTHLPGQYYELRLTAEDGYQAARPYSASAPAKDDNMIELTITLMPDGEVSPYLFDLLAVGDKVELRGPLGKFFVWEPSMLEPFLLLAGGSGIVPARCVLQAYEQAAPTTPMALLYSTSAYEDIIFRDELLSSDKVTITLTRSHPEDWRGKTGRINQALIQEILAKLPERPMCYVCGMTSFVEAGIGLLLEAGIPPAWIKAERFGA